MRKVSFLPFFISPLVVIFALSNFYGNITLAASKASKISSPTKRSSNNKITITGTIINFDHAKKYFAQGSHLVFYNSEKGIIGTLMSDGSIMVDDSNLPKTQFSEGGNFKFEVTSLEPAKYIILLQPVKGFTTGNASIALVVDENTKNTVEIKYPFETGDANKLDLHNVLLKTP